MIDWLSVFVTANVFLIVILCLRAVWSGQQVEGLREELCRARESEGAWREEAEELQDKLNNCVSARLETVERQCADLTCREAPSLAGRVLALEKWRDDTRPAELSAGSIVFTEDECNGPVS